MTFFSQQAELYDWPLYDACFHLALNRQDQSAGIMLFPGFLPEAIEIEGTWGQLPPRCLRH